MSERDAYGNEMEFLRRLGTEDEERMIAGDAPSRGDFAEVAAFTRALRASLRSQTLPPASGVFAARLAETARGSAAPTEPRAAHPPARPRRRLALVARVAVAVATVPLLFAGLAFAGVGLPGPADDAFETLGIELPNQAADKPATDDDTEGTAKDGDSAGSATGQENSAGKLGHGKTKDKGKRGKALAHGKAKDKENQGKALGRQDLAPGRDVSETKRPDDPGGSSNSGAASGGGGGSGKSGGGSEGVAPVDPPGGGSPPSQGRGPGK